MTTKHYVEYLCPGPLFSEEFSRELPERSSRAALVLAPRNSFAFRLYDLPGETPDLGPEFTVVPKRENVSHRYYIDGEIVTRQQVAEWGPEFRILHSNMGNQGWDPMVRCRTGNFQPLEDGEIVTSLPEETR